MITIKLKIFGKVQNVSFRKMVLEQANRLHVKGWIKNTTSINVVEVCLQGRKEKIESLIDFIRSSPGRSEVEELKVKKIKSEEIFESFRML